MVLLPDVPSTYCLLDIPGSDALFHSRESYKMRLCWRTRLPNNPDKAYSGASRHFYYTALNKVRPLKIPLTD